MNLHFTNHAVERFVSRHRPDLTLTEAKQLLKSASSQATPMREPTPLGDMQFRMRDPDCILVVKRDAQKVDRVGRNRQRRTDQSLVCVTILPAREEWDDTADCEEGAA